MEQLYSICHIEKATMFLPQRDSTMVFFHFFSKLAEGIKREGSFPVLFASSRSEPVSCTRSTRKTGNFMEWSSIVADIRPFLLILLLLRFSCPVSFLVFATDTIYSRTIELPLSTWTITRVSENNLFPFGTFSRANHRVPLENWIIIIVKWEIILLIRKVLNENNKRI